MDMNQIYNRMMHFLTADGGEFRLDVSEASAGAIGNVLRWVLPILALLIVGRCAYSLFSQKNEPETWAHLKFPDGSFAPIRHWENLLGRSRSADLVLNFPSISKTHAVLSRSQDGQWRITDAGSKSGVLVDGKKVSGTAPVAFGSKITMGGLDFQLVAPTRAEAIDDCQPPRRSAFTVHPLLTLVLLSAFQFLMMLGLCVNLSEVNPFLFLFAFGGLIVLEWLYYVLMRLIRRKGFEIEYLALFLTTLGFAATASVNPDQLIKQLVALALGMGLFLFLGWLLRDLSRSQLMRWILSALGLLLLASSFLFAEEINGARNWLVVGGFSVQPSEFAKICFVWAGSATMDRLVRKRNLIFYILFACACTGLLALSNDFGTAAIYFVTFVLVAFLRSGSFSAFLFSGAGAGLAAVLVLRFRPYVLNRFKAWRHVWDYVDSLGYQQTRVMIYAASGGLLGLGVGLGALKHVAAADSDLVFGMLCEEQGLLMAGLAVCCLALLAAFSFFRAKNGRSTFYTIASCTAMGMLVFQTILNVFGAVDLLPLTGVTFPFVSNGGSSLIATWGLLAFVKAVDLRPGASFAIKEVSEKGVLE